MTLTFSQKQDIVRKYLREKGLTFGNSYGDEMAEDLGVAMLTYQENIYEQTSRSYFVTHSTLLVKNTNDEQDKLKALPDYLRC